MKKLFKNNLAKIMLVLSLVTTALVVVDIIGINSGKSSHNVDESTTGGLRENDLYILPNRPTDYQKEVYKSLNIALETYKADGENTQEKEEEVCGLVVKNFVADFYTWSNKNSSYDVGGITYIVGHSFLLFENQARNNFYKNVDTFVAEYGRENLMEVSNVEVKVFKSDKYFFDGEGYDNYYIEAEWQYADESLMDVDQLPSSSAFQVINYQGIWQIAQFWGMG